MQRKKKGILRLRVNLFFKSNEYLFDSFSLYSACINILILLGGLIPPSPSLSTPLPSVYSHRLLVSNLAFAYTHFELIERYPRTMLHCTSEINNTRRRYRGWPGARVRIRGAEIRKRANDARGRERQRERDKSGGLQE